MLNFVKTTLVAVSLATAGMSASVAPAAASSFSFSFGVGPGYHSSHWRAPRPARGYCAPNKALRKARRMGIRHARIVRANRRVVKVAGRSRGHRVQAVFANTRRCPVIARR
ncbi:hypothetical protein [Pseudohoeflea coraliihabitans]|uniref:Antifreeze protein n=1 Tax=Pseudohoeflea coraliihabitans TaxID=2860393 RepID=A0ABS6WKV6_9HYPH|nr:hypothetical protein [Pseudohoeflea sp. DP4N28-3]MBW3096057.1 hypothetical protein [Pseudohoeflea sp. DP4N28-3]